jgi:hypothetical protein
MTFGGEPLLYTDAVYAIMTAAKDLNIPKRQIITNGYFSKNADKIREVAERLAECGVNDLLLSVDAFHQETIPLDVVRQFASEAKTCGIPIRLQPAWLVSATNDNPYNRKTRKILDSFADMGISVNEGNVIFPEGNALKYLKEYFDDNPYITGYIMFEPGILIHSCPKDTKLEMEKDFDSRDPVFVLRYHYDLSDEPEISTLSMYKTIICTMSLWMTWAQNLPMYNPMISLAMLAKYVSYKSEDFNVDAFIDILEKFQGE